MFYWCYKYDGRVTDDKALNICVLKGCPNLDRSHRKNGRVVNGRLPSRWAQDDRGVSKAKYRAPHKRELVG